jgi:transposase
MTAYRRKRLSRAETLALASEFESSNLTRKEFCEQRGLSMNSLSRYLRRFRDEGKPVGQQC